MNNIIHLQKNNIKVIEDCSQAHGASIKKICWHFWRHWCFGAFVTINYKHV